MDDNQTLDQSQTNSIDKPTPVFSHNPNPLSNTNPPPSNDDLISPLDFLNQSEVIQKDTISDQPDPVTDQPQSNFSQPEPISPLPPPPQPSNIDFSQDSTYVIDPVTQAAEPIDNQNGVLTPTELDNQKLYHSVENPYLKQAQEPEPETEITKSSFSKSKAPQLSYFKALLLIGPIFLAICLAISFYLINQKLENPLEVLLMIPLK